MSDSNPTEIDKNVQIGDSVSNSEKKSRKDKSKSLSTKVVIRRLPPSMDEETFLNQIQPVPEYDYFYFVTADWSLGQNATSRAYINFINDEDIFIFKDRFDGYVFVETKGGVEYPAIVEFAPFQLPKSKSRKKDNKCNTIETDPDFIKFMTLLNGEVGDVKPEMKMEYSYQIKDEKKITSTPLLEYIANKKVERREERKKKIDDRKRQRDDERNRKKTQVAKSIPSSIREQDEDGIIVRVVKSRPRDRGDRMKKDRNSESSSKPTSSDAKQNKPESNRDEKRRLEREQRDIRRKEERQRFREERDQKRQAERDRNRKERDNRDNNKKDEAKTEKSSAKVDTDVPNKGNQKEDRVKRYSESRRARMENKEQSDAGNKLAGGSDKSGNKFEKNEAVPEKSTTVKSDETKDESKEKPEPAVKLNDGGKSNVTEDAKNNDDSSGDNGRESSKSLTKEERLARRIRNKDRPSLQIYQPGQSKRRMSTKKDDDRSADDASPKILSKPSSPTLSENSIVFPTEKPNTSVKNAAEKLKKEKPATVDRVKSQQSNEKPQGRSEKSQDNSKSSNKSGQSISKTNQSQDEPVPVERKVSRYSERRNKIKEKQNLKYENTDAAIEAKEMTDESKNNPGEINNSEV